MLKLIFSVEPPIITRKFNASSCKAGDRVVLECEYSGSEPDVNWYRNGSPIVNAGQVQIVNDLGYTALVIPSAQHLSSTGTYSVEIKNDSGSASNAAALSVEGRV